MADVVTYLSMYLGVVATERHRDPLPGHRGILDTWTRHSSLGDPILTESILDLRMSLKFSELPSGKLSVATPEQPLAAENGCIESNPVSNQ